MSTEQPAADSNPQPVPVSHNPLKDHALEAKEVPEVLDFLRDNGTAMLIGLSLAVVAFLGWSVYRTYRSSQERTASNLLFNSRAAEQFQQVIDQYPKTSAAPLAHLTLASIYYDESQFEMAQHVFAQFLQKFPGHEMVAAAQLGNVQCQEALNQLEEAADGYARFAQEHPGHYLAPNAIFGRARCLEQLGRLDEAKAAYEDFIVAHPEDRWSARAESAIGFIEKELRARRQAPAGAALAAPAAGNPVFVSPVAEAPVAPAPVAP